MITKNRPIGVSFARGKNDFTFPALTDLLELECAFAETNSLQPRYTTHMQAFYPQ